jgi:Amt family ammonium transporter
MQSVDMAGHNSSLFVLGVMILWFVWYGFNTGSQLAIVTPIGSTYSVASAVSNAAVTTSLAPAAAGLTGLLVTAVLLKLKTGKHHWNIIAMGNSTLAGLVAITAGCSTVYPWAAIVIGIVSGFLYPLASRLMVFIRVCSHRHMYWLCMQLMPILANLGCNVECAVFPSC